MYELRRFDADLLVVDHLAEPAFNICAPQTSTQGMPCTPSLSRRGHRGWARRPWRYLPAPGRAIVTVRRDGLGHGIAGRLGSFILS